MRLKWKTNTVFKNQIDITPDNINDPALKEKGVITEFGIFEISITYGRTYKDGTRQCLTFVKIPFGSREIITLCKTKGFMPDAIAATENILFSEPWPMEVNNNDNP